VAPGRIPALRDHRGHNYWRLRKAEQRSFKQGCVLAWGATIYLGLALYGFVWALVHAIDNR
jgi:hypothetical protein